MMNEVELKKSKLFYLLMSVAAFLILQKSMKVLRFLVLKRLISISLLIH